MASLDRLMLAGMFGLSFILLILVIGNASISGLTVNEILPGGSVSVEKGGDIVAKREIFAFTIGILVLTIAAIVVTYFLHKKFE